MRDRQRADDGTDLLPAMSAGGTISLGAMPNFEPVVRSKPDIGQSLPS
jgi:hypothetical protein